MRYRDTLTFDLEDTLDARKAIEEFINGIGYVVEHKSEDSLEFYVEADDEWDLCEKVDEIRWELETRGISFIPEKLCIERP